jgi:hypothetical protein
MRIYIELNSLEEGRDALEALTLYKEAGMGSALFEKKEEPKKEAPAPVKEPKKENPPVAPAVAPAEPEPEPEPAAPSLSEVREAVKALQEAVGKEDTKKLLAAFGAKGASSVDEKDRAEFIAKAEVLIHG